MKRRDDAEQRKLAGEEERQFLNHGAHDGHGEKQGRGVPLQGNTVTRAGDMSPEFPAPPLLGFAVCIVFAVVNGFFTMYVNPGKYTKDGAS